jgi:hypothetical protein
MKRGLNMQITTLFRDEDGNQIEDIVQYTKDNIKDITNYIIYLEALNEDINEILILAKNKDFMLEYVNHIEEDIDDRLRAFNFLTTTYLISEKIKRKEKEYKILLLNKYIELNKGYIDKLEEILEGSRNFAIDVSIFMPQIWKKEYTHNIEKRVYRFTSKIYNMFKIDNSSKDSDRLITKTNVLKLLYYVFGKGKYFDDVLYYLLLELKDRTDDFDSRQIIIWNMITNMILEELNNLSEKRIYNILKRYILHIEDDGCNNYQRRIEICNNVALEDYPSLAKVCSQLREEFNILF